MCIPDFHFFFNSDVRLYFCLFSCSQMTNYCTVYFFDLIQYEKNVHSSSYELTLIISYLGQFWSPVLIKGSDLAHPYKYFHSVKGERLKINIYRRLHISIQGINRLYWLRRVGKMENPILSNLTHQKFQFILDTLRSRTNILGRLVIFINSPVWTVLIRDPPFIDSE